LEPTSGAFLPRHGRDDDTGVMLDLDLPAMLLTFCRLRPETKEIAVVVGHSPVERFWAGELRRDFQQFTDRVTSHGSMI